MYEFIIFIKVFTINKDAGKSFRFYRHKKHYIPIRSIFVKEAMNYKEFILKGFQDYLRRI